MTESRKKVTQTHTVLSMDITSDTSNVWKDGAENGERIENGMNDNISRHAVQDALEKCECTFDGGYDMNDVDAIIADLPSVDEWVPCSERLPDEYDEYLCQDADGEMLVLWLENAEWCRKYVVKENIVAWMPLPEAYKGGTK